MRGNLDVLLEDDEDEPNFLDVMIEIRDLVRKGAILGASDIDFEPSPRGIIVYVLTDGKYGNWQDYDSIDSIGMLVKIRDDLKERLGQIILLPDYLYDEDYDEAMKLKRELP